MPTVIRKYETHIEELEREKLLVQEKLSSETPQQGSFEEMFKLTMSVLEKPHKLWQSGGFEHKRTVLKLTFTDRMLYSRKTVVQTTKTSLPLSMLVGFYGRNSDMVRVKGLEPPRLAASEPKSGASANFATPA